MSTKELKNMLNGISNVANEQLHSITQLYTYNNSTYHLLCTAAYTSYLIILYYYGKKSRPRQKCIRS